MPTKQLVVLSITNAVVQTQTANALLAIGASPIMSHCVNEIRDILAFTSAVNVNIGTLNEQQIPIFDTVLDECEKLKIPVSFDPVGFGASQLRNTTTLTLLEKYSVSVIKGNADEIIALSDECQLVENTIDSQHQSTLAIHAAKKLSSRYNCVVAVTGETDFCIDCDSVIEINGGHRLMSRVTGMGCIANALIASYLDGHQAIDATAHALRLMAHAGEMAGLTAKGPQSFYTAFIDMLYQLTK